MVLRGGTTNKKGAVEFVIYLSYVPAYVRYAELTITITK